MRDGMEHLEWPDGRQRCFWANPKNECYVRYHDEEWGRPVHDDGKLFEMLLLECFQAGLVGMRAQQARGVPARFRRLSSGKGLCIYGSGCRAADAG